MINKIDTTIISRLLFDDRFKVYQHLLLLLFIILISADIFSDAPDKINLSTERFYMWTIYFMLMIVPIYINIYVLVPRFLIKNKLLIYLVCTLFSIFCEFAILIVIFELLFETPVKQQQPNIVELLLYITATMMNSGLLTFSTSAILLFKHWLNTSLRISQLESATLQSELNFLKSQINPHFLFNMLNNANIKVKKNAALASEILIKLDDLLCYQINDSTREEVKLSADISFLNDFLNLEKMRRDYFDCSISKEGDVSRIMVPPLLFIPFVENATKHNLDSKNLSYVHVSFKIESDKLTFICENSKPQTPQIRNEGGLGLTNIKRRLDLLYGNDYSLELQDRETTFTVNLNLKI